MSEELFHLPEHHNQPQGSSIAHGREQVPLSEPQTPQSSPQQSSWQFQPQGDGAEQEQPMQSSWQSQPQGDGAAQEQPIQSSWQSQPQGDGAAQEQPIQSSWQSQPRDDGTEPPPRQEPQSAASSTGSGYGQYSPHVGYQKDTARRNDEYRWSFEEYETVEHRQPPRKNRGLLVFGVLLATVLVVGLVGLSTVGIYSLMSRADEDYGVPPVSKAPETLFPEEDNSVSNAAGLTILDRPSDGQGVTTEDGSLTTKEIAKRVRPSVVGIIQYSNYSSYEPTGQGSGIIMSADGYVLTNAHVVEGAIGISVEIDDGSSYAAELIGIDTKTDLAVLRIQAENLVAAQFGNSDELEIGERVVAIGNPGGSVLAGSVTQGIVSGVDRMLSSGGYSARYIQVDAAINPGNSGGALVNEFGQVVGINSSKIADIDYEGIGFAIPINEAKPVIDDLLAYGYVKGRCKIGLTGTEINEGYSRISSIPVGILINTIDPTSDLAGKNINRGDILTHIDGERIETFDDVAAILKLHQPGDMVRLTVYRSDRSGNGRSIEADIRLQEDVDTSSATPGR